MYYSGYESTHRVSLQLAIDEAMLIGAEQGIIGEGLRIWESKRLAVVLGSGSYWKSELNPTSLHLIPIYRRISGGCAVVQGPGCLNFSLVLSRTQNRLRSPCQSYKIILAPLIRELNRIGIDSIVLEGRDLTLRGRKFSGNAQCWRTNFILHHGTILYNFDISMIKQYLSHPPTEPDYRKGRPHDEFLTNLPLDRTELIDVIQRAWPPVTSSPLPSQILECAIQLEQTKYNAYGWIFRR